jgi:WD40 repeat protein/serine/threonine protein kinase
MKHEKAARPAYWTEWEPGNVLLDLYEVKGLLGEGGMGRVYKVHHRVWGSDLAVKAPRSEVFAASDGKANFVREAETWVNLGLHPHAVSCYYVRTVGSVPCVFAEYVEGGSLSDWIRSRRLYEGGTKAALERILDVAIQFAWGLHYAHEQGLVHQDVKPANVMLTPDGTTKITDFGLARARSMAGESAAIGGTHSVLVSVGGMTPAYCSPEQARRQPLSRRTDIWSWGLSLLEMFAGQVTWTVGSVANEALAGHLGGGSLDGAIPKMPEGVIRILRQCFAGDAGDRPSSMQHVAEELRQVFEQVAHRAHARPAPKADEHSADSLNNRALSYLDLGKAKDAEDAWSSALGKEARHLESNYNQGLIRWRRGDITDEELLDQLALLRPTHGPSWQFKHLWARVQLERGVWDMDLLLEAHRDGGGDPEANFLEMAMALTRNYYGRATWEGVIEGHSGRVLSATLSADGKMALSGSGDGTAALWRLRDEKTKIERVHILEGHAGPVFSVCLSADGRWALTGSKDHTLRLWETASGRCVFVFEGHRDSVLSVHLTPDGRLALSGSADGTLMLWDIVGRSWVRVFEGHAGIVRSVCLSSDARLALSGGDDGTLRLWEVGTQHSVASLEGHAGSVNSVCFGPADRQALTGSSDRSLRLWDLAKRRLLRTLYGHTASVTSVALSANGRWALSGGEDNVVRLWEVDTRRCLRTLRGHTGFVSSVAFGTGQALSGSLDRTLRGWRLEEERLPASFEVSRVRPPQEKGAAH